jgi:hypothetical protein
LDGWLNISNYLLSQEESRSRLLHLDNGFTLMRQEIN